tara:strand:+ start:192 stop:425 length:234 start_codon:yes stop_codon:yes gene_type:complete
VAEEKEKVEVQEQLIQEEALLKHQGCPHLYNHSVSVMLEEMELLVAEVQVDMALVVAGLGDQEILQVDLQMVVMENQ